MKVAGALLLTLSAITPAASVYVIVPGVIAAAGSGAIWSLLAAAAVGLAMAFTYAELGSAHPIAGGEYALIGRTAGPTIGFVYLGMNAVSCALAPAVMALGAGQYLAAVWPGAPHVPIGVGVLAFASLLGVLNIRTNAVVTGIFLSIEVLALVLLAWLGFSHGQRSPAELVSHPHFVNGGRLGPAPLAAIGLATAQAIFAYDGFGAVMAFSEEMLRARERVAITIVAAFLLTVVLEFVPTFAVLLGTTDLKNLIASSGPFSDFVAGAGGRGLSIAVSLGIALAILNAAVAIVLVNARFFYSAGRDGAWPAPVNAALARIHPRFHSPWIANLAGGVVAMPACFLPLRLLLVFTGASVVVKYALVSGAAIAGRLNGGTAHGRYRMPAFPAGPVLVMASLAYVLYANWIDRALGRPSLIATGVILGGAVCYATAMRMARGSGWVVAGPADEGG
ncbi:MAG TPA: APC family permease [Caulobacteraceae bacterium]|nr:APC family permease [Caulobacteraceae bacterium]